MIELIKDAKLTDDMSEEACEKVENACNICAQREKPKSLEKISINHANKALTENIQTVFFVAHIQHKQYFILNIICSSTVYRYRMVKKSRNAKKMVACFDKRWTYRQGVLKSFGAHREFSTCNSVNYFNRTLLRCRYALRDHLTRTGEPRVIIMLSKHSWQTM